MTNPHDSDAFLVPLLQRYPGTAAGSQSDARVLGLALELVRLLSQRVPTADTDSDLTRLVETIDQMLQPRGTRCTRCNGSGREPGT